MKISMSRPTENHRLRIVAIARPIPPDRDIALVGAELVERPGVGLFSFCQRWLILTGHFFCQQDWCTQQILHISYHTLNVHALATILRVVHQKIVALGRCKGDAVLPNIHVCEYLSFEAFKFSHSTDYMMAGALVLPYLKHGLDRPPQPERQDPVGASQ